MTRNDMHRTRFMRRQRRLLKGALASTSVALVVLLSGCASVPPSAGVLDAAPPAATIMAPAMTVPRDGTGVVVVLRDPTYYGSGCGNRVLVNGKPVAELDRGEKVTLYLAPGEHVVGVRIVSRICTEASDEVTVVSVVGKRSVYQVSPAAGLQATIRIRAVN